VPRKAKPNRKYKLKTHKATAKRFKATGSGKLMRTKIGKGHLRRHTPKRVKALFMRTIEVKGRKIRKRVHRLAPYLKKYQLNPSS
jgi:large subunit ribosomal protein L35